MKANILPALFLCALMTWITPAAANDFEHVWVCSIQPGHSLDEVRSAGSEWLNAARGMPGGEELELVIRWPIAVPDSSEVFEFVIRAPSLQAWGKFYDTYDPDSPVGKADEVFASVASCSGSTVWESITLEQS